MSRLHTTIELWHLLVHNKKWWLFPVVFVLVALGATLAVAGGTALAPFIYTMF
jgi:Family of unknown function (DUF5989)